MVSSITQDPYSIIISLNLASSVNLNIGAPPRPTELPIIEISIRTIRAGKIKIQNAKSRVRAHGPGPRDGPPRYDRTVNRCVPYCEILLVFLLKVKPSVIRDSEGKRHERTRKWTDKCCPRALSPGRIPGHRTYSIRHM